MKKEKEPKEKKCKNGNHRYGATADSRYLKCYHCNSVKIVSK